LGERLFFSTLAFTLSDVLSIDADAFQKFVPMIGDKGYVVASYATVVEVSREMISDRRLASFQSMAMHLANVRSLSGFWGSLINGLESNDKDLPLVLLYSVNKLSQVDQSPTQISSGCTLKEYVGVSESDISALLQVDLATEAPGLGEIFRDCITSADPDIKVFNKSDLPYDLFSSTTWRGFGVYSEEFVLIPIHTKY